MATSSSTREPIIKIDPVRVAVFRYDEGTQTFAWLPNIRLVNLGYREDGNPPIVRYRYEFDQAAPPGWPRSLEDCMLPAGAGGVGYVVGMDDRIVACVVAGDGTMAPIADGYALIPQGNVGETTDQVTFDVADTSWREWDYPLYAPFWRDGRHPDTAVTFDPANPPAPADDQDNTVDGNPIRFNPNGLPNCTLAGADHAEVGGPTFPIFVDETLTNRAPDPRRHWTLPNAVQYCCSAANPEQKYTINPLYGTLLKVLVAYEETNPGAPIDLDDPTTYKEVDVRVPDVDVKGMAWPEAVRTLITPHGFGCRFKLFSGGYGPGPSLPTHKFIVYRKDFDPTRKVKLFLAARGSWMDYYDTNLAGLTIQRDAKNIENAYIAITTPAVVEFAAVLVPAFKYDPTDVTALPGNSVSALARRKYDSLSPEFKGNENMYRRWRFAEAGDDYYAVAIDDWSSQPPDLMDLLLRDPTKKDRRTFALRRRPALANLLTTDVQGRALKSQLWISADYRGNTSYNRPPKVWDKDRAIGDNEHWQRVKSNWRSTDDELGIIVTCQQPWNWTIGIPPDDQLRDAPFPGGVVDIIRCMVKQTDPTPFFYLKFLCAIRKDYMIDAAAPRRTTSPTRFEIARLDDVKDRFEIWYRDASSPYALAALKVGAQEIIRDDTKPAKAHVEARRKARENADFAGPVVVPYITFAYDIGDFVTEIDGRNIDLNGSTATGSAGSAPAIVGIDWHFDGDQTTTFHLSDRRGEAYGRDEAVRFTEAGNARRARSAALDEDDSDEARAEARGRQAAFAPTPLNAIGVTLPSLPGFKP